MGKQSGIAFFGYGRLCSDCHHNRRKLELFTKFLFSVPPFSGTALLIASVFWIFGNDNQMAWQIFQDAIVFVAAAGISFNIKRITNSHLLAFGFFLIVTFSKPSIFWRLKYATEGAAEAFLYCTIRALLSSVGGRRTIVAMAMLGGAGIVTCLIRPKSAE